MSYEEEKAAWDELVKRFRTSMAFTAPEIMETKAEAFLGQAFNLGLDLGMKRNQRAEVDG